MKKLLVSILVLLITGYVHGQDDIANAMAKLSALSGKWQGSGWIQQQTGRIEFEQTENVQLKLNGTSLLVEGKGYANDSLAFQAMAVISYDPVKTIYRFNSFLADGRYTDATGQFNDKNEFVWQFNTPNNGIVQYTINFTETSWNEKGSFSGDGGNQWYPFFEMKLTKTND